MSSFLMGTPGFHEQRSTLGQDQRPILQNLTSTLGQGGGAFGDLGNYYRNLLSGGDQQLQAMIAPEQRRFQQETIPGLANQFAGIGAGGALSGSGFRNAAIQAGTDLTERIAGLRAGLRQQGAQGLMGLGQQGLGQYYANTYTPRTPGLIEALAPALGQAAGAALGGGANAGLSALLPLLQQLMNQKSGNSGVA